MNIKLATTAGFCFGVKRAVNLALKAAEDYADRRIYTLGPIIHNPQVVAKLSDEGLRVVDNLSDIESGTLVVRSHGLPREVLSAARERGFEIVDATCPFVKMAQDRAAQLEEEGYAVVVVGEQDHPEVLSITGSLSTDAAVVTGPDDLGAQAPAERVGIVCQTTQPIERLTSVVARLLTTAQEVKVFNTICSATSERQVNALELARSVDVMLIVGGRNSANTRRLWELCREAGSDAYHIETSDELEPTWFEGKTEVGVTGGASTPQWIIDDVVRVVEALENSRKGEESRPESAW